LTRANLQIAVIGAGAFGGWTALYLLRRGARVTLVDAWGPGNSRASSGGETRIFRGGYGANQPYTKMAARALQLWQEHELRWNRKFLHKIGVLWMAHGDDAFERASLAELRTAGLPYQELSAGDLNKRWPQVYFEDVSWGFLETEAGSLMARSSCQAVVEAFLAEGGEFLEVAVIPDRIEEDALNGLTLSDGSKLVADQYVFACGPWLGKIFPRALGDKITATKQDVFFFGTPPGNRQFDDKYLPVWADHRDQFFYGIPGNDRRGFKIADDTRGPAFDPTWGERVVSAEKLKAVREYVAFRFPGMKDAPLVETRVCQYENSPDHNLIIDRHPTQENVWIVGGGSGHGFKHGPAVGELVAELVTEQKEADAVFRLGRFGAS
jgi:glycine/D-amino acid oxidase-like deaminating enzyme